MITNALPLIESVQPLARDPDLVRVIVDGKSWCIVSIDFAVAAGLKPGRELSVTEKETIDQEVNRERAKLFCLRSLSARAQSRTELARKLRGRGYEEQLIDEVLSEVAGFGFLDDRLLAQELISGLRDRGYWLMWARQKMRERGLSGDWLEELLGEGFPAGEEIAAAEAALASTSRYRGDPRKAASFLARRGFSSGVCWTVAGRQRADEDLPDAAA